MSRGLIAILLVAVSMVIIGTLVIQNGAPANVVIFGSTISMTVGTAMLLCYVVAAAACGGAAFLVKQNKVVQEKHLAQWEAQDQKLMQTVQSDKEKQLEAKIETLESALKQALKRGS